MFGTWLYIEKHQIGLGGEINKNVDQYQILFKEDMTFTSNQFFGRQQGTYYILKNELFLKYNNSEFLYWRLNEKGEVAYDFSFEDGFLHLFHKCEEGCIYIFEKTETNILAKKQNSD